MMHAMSAIGGLLAVALAAVVAASAAWADAPFDMVDIPGGSFEMGDADGRPDEAPRRATVAPFRLMLFEVTNAQFAVFVAETGHVTDPERRGFGYVWPDAGPRCRAPTGGIAAGRLPIPSASTTIRWSR